MAVDRLFQSCPDTRACPGTWAGGGAHTAHRSGSGPTHSTPRHLARCFSSPTPGRHSSIIHQDTTLLFWPCRFRFASLDFIFSSRAGKMICRVGTVAVMVKRLLCD